MENPLYDKAVAFADRVLDMSDYLLSAENAARRYSVEVVVKQCTRSGTSIGANIAEGLGAQSSADLTAKLSIAYKEARETEYWMERLLKRNCLTQQMYDSLYEDLEEILKLLVSSLNTLKNGRK